MALEKKDIMTVPYPDHPQRCQGLAGPHDNKVQCNKMVNNGGKYCVLHGAVNKDMALEKEQQNLYRVRKYQARIADFKIANGARSLDDELAIMRMVLEEVLEKCSSQNELLLYSQKITETIREIKSLVLATEKLAARTGMLVGRSEAVVLAGKVVEIISLHIVDETLMNRMANDIIEAFVTPDLEHLPDYTSNN